MNLAESGPATFAARVVADFGRRFVVATAAATPAVRGAVRRGKRDDVVVGDEVVCGRLGDDDAVIEAVLPRSRLLFRSAATRTKLLAANVDRVAIVFAAQPAFNSHFIWRALVAAAAADVAAVVVLNKIDLPDPDGRAARLLDDERARGTPGVRVSVRGATEAARGTLREVFEGHRTLLVGQSGMGKSSIVNLLVPDASERTREFSARLNVGRQTTTASRWFDLPGGGALVDAPGFQQFGLAHVAPRRLDALLPEFAELAGQCRFADCRHLAEPGCAVRAAVDRGAIDAQRHAFYRELLAELSR
ncbi:MAG TPA: ribosome small subunit-dependent GTPase A [Burkholderiaceae bacterium]|nr:ribosome small subunit-dependent GTPase A [Burkholderiaceae bacterium]